MRFSCPNRGNQKGFFLFLTPLYLLQALCVCASACCFVEEWQTEMYLSSSRASGEAVPVILSLKCSICCLKSRCECLEAACFLTRVFLFLGSAGL